jgi:hypothetical protein
MSVDLPLTGGCLCGAVRFEVDAPLVSASWCHCSRCRRRTGTPASAQARIVPGSLRLIRGEEVLREFKPDDEGYPKVFCGECGSALWSRNPDDSTALGVRLGAFDGDPGIRPEYHQYVAYAAVWAPIPDDGLPRYPERKPA